MSRGQEATPVDESVPRPSGEGRDAGVVGSALIKGLTDGPFTSNGCSPAPEFALVRPSSEIPMPVVYRQCSDFVTRERHFRVPANLDDTALAGHNLIESPAILEHDGDDLIARSGLCL